MNSQTVNRERSQVESRATAPRTELDPRHDLIDYAKMYAREKPGVAALWCFGIGFIVGWKLKPW